MGTLAKGSWSKFLLIETVFQAKSAKAQEHIDCSA